MIDSFSAEGEVRLRDVCELCTCFQGPIPSFQLSPHDWPVPLPAGVLSAKLESGRADVTIHNQVGFDILYDGDGHDGIPARRPDGHQREGEHCGRLVLTEPSRRGTPSSSRST